MPLFDLKPHPASPPTYAYRVGAYAQRAGPHEIALRFSLMGDLNLISLTPPVRGAKRQRLDGLWQRTCFECFCKPAVEERYVELNVASNGDWAAYRFARQRVGMTAADVATDRFRVKGLRGGLQVSATFDLPELSSGAWMLGLSAVIESIDGTKSYWALAHAPGPPDFHNPACFIATLPAPDAP